jgi:trans-aconitate methyltransferase
MDTEYRNYDHYITEGWLKRPKVSAVALGDLLQRHQPQPAGCLLDIGCATGELMAYLGQRFPSLQCTGMDVFDELVTTGRRLLPSATFVKGSVLEPPPQLLGAFDIVTAIGVMSIFDEAQLERFWRNLLACCKPGGVVVVLSPLNEYGIDALIRHRKRRDGQRLDWETGWNIYAIETVRELLSSLGADEVQMERFVFQQVLAPREDRIRTWTLPTRDHPHQLTNGLKLLVDHYFIHLRRP